MSMKTEIRLEETFTPVKNPFYGKMVTKNVYVKEVDFEKMGNPNLPKQGFVLNFGFRKRTYKLKVGKYAFGFVYERTYKLKVGKYACGFVYEDTFTSHIRSADYIFEVNCKAKKGNVDKNSITLSILKDYGDTDSMLTEEIENLSIEMIDEKEK